MEHIHKDMVIHYDWHICETTNNLCNELTLATQAVSRRPLVGFAAAWPQFHRCMVVVCGPGGCLGLAVEAPVGRWW